jgi:hypothetical protein
MTREALKLALEALEHEADKGNDDAYKVERDAIKEALAQPEQGQFALKHRIAELEGAVIGLQAQRTWVGLTLDERIELAKDVDWPVGAYCEYAEKIEAKLKEKNELR